MRTVRIMAIAAALGAMWISATPAVVGAQDKAHWLVGTWVGDVEGMRSSKYGTTRYMKVGEVQPDGVLKAGWGVNEPKVGSATATLAEDRVQLMTNENTRVELSKVDDAHLQGTFTPTNGRAYPIRMKKQ
jgi:hypothetical protein